MLPASATSLQGLISMREAAYLIHIAGIALIIVSGLMFMVVDSSMAVGYVLEVCSRASKDSRSNNLQRTGARERYVAWHRNDGAFRRRH